MIHLNLLHSLLYHVCRDKSVRVYKWQVGDKFVEVGYSPLLGHTYGVNCVNFSPFGSKLASASIDGSTIIWDVKVLVFHLCNNSVIWLLLEFFILTIAK